MTVTALLALTLAACTTTREAALLDARLRSDGRVVDIVAAACNPTHTDVTLDEAPGEVQALVTVTAPSENEDCATEAAIELDEPLGDRAVADALTQRRVDVSR